MSIKEGVALHLVGSCRFRTAAKHGLPFVAFTRSESFAMTAFKNLPPWGDFVKGRDSGMLRMRQDFTRALEQLHRRTLAKHSALKTPALEQAAQEAFREGQVKRRKLAGPLMPCPCCQALQ